MTLDNVTGDLLAYTCPDHVHNNAYCKHMIGINNATNDGTLTAFPATDDY